VVLTERGIGASLAVNSVMVVINN